MKRVLALLLCAVLLTGVTACKKNKKQDTTTPTTTTTEKQDPTYALDPMINRFFTEFIEKYGDDSLDVQSIRRGPGTESTKPEDLIKEYIATIDGLTVTVRNASYKVETEGQDPQTVYLLRVAIEGGTTEASRDKMLNIFSLVARATDPGCTITMTNIAVEDMKKRTETISTNDYYKVSNYVNVLHYTPFNPQYGVPARIEMQTMNYVPLED